MEKIQEIHQKRSSTDSKYCLPVNSRSPKIIKNGAVHNNNGGSEPMLQHIAGDSNAEKQGVVNIAFQDIKFTVSTWSLRKGREPNEILSGLTGEFRGGELTAIMGPSGAGKSTLLNILAGYVARGADGSVLVNGKPRKMKEFSHLSCYIQQDDNLRGMLTARELMINTSHLKLGSTRSSQEKSDQVSHILGMLGLEECQHTRCACLSGGQKKRLSIALELISNPHVLFLDEPTTGLDSSSTYQCVSMLKMLATQGRTIICTIHQPSAMLYEMFDQLYALSSGRCIYQGKAKGLLPYLEKFGLHCPAYNNPADFLMDVAMGEFGADVDKLANAVEMGLGKTKHAYIGYEPKDVEMKAMTDTALITNNLSPPEFEEIDNGSTKLVVTSSPASSLFSQFCLLLCRNIKSIGRDSGRILIRLVVHIVIAVIFGYLYRGVGNDATTVLGNCVFIYGTILFLVYTGKMAVTLSFPIEFNMLQREHFNRWYSIAPYFLSLILIEIPVQILCASLYFFISYPLTGQPMEAIRMWPAYILCVTASLTAQSFGFLIGITMPVKVAVFIGPVIAVVLSMFGFNIFYRDIPIVFKWLFQLSYFRAGYQGVMFTLYNNRSVLPCPEDTESGVDYCHFKFPNKFLQEMDIVNIDVPFNMMFIIIWGLCLYVFTLFAVWWRLNRR